MMEFDDPKEIKNQGSIDEDPKCKKGFSFQDPPMRNKIGIGKIFKRQGQFDKAKDNLDGIHPSPGSGQGLQPAGEKSKESEGKTQGQSKARHGDGQRKG